MHVLTIVHVHVQRMCDIYFRGKTRRAIIMPCRLLCGSNLWGIPPDSKKSLIACTSLHGSFIVYPAWLLNLLLLELCAFVAVRTDEDGPIIAFSFKNY